MRRISSVHRRTRNGKGLSNMSMMHVCSAATYNAALGIALTQGSRSAQSHASILTLAIFKCGAGGGPGGYDGIKPWSR